jgi:hypothetical protein
LNERKDVHSRINNINLKQLDKAYINRLKAIDSNAVSEGLMEFVEGLKLIHHNEIIFSDHRAYIVDINIEDYFNDQMSSWDKINHVMLIHQRKVTVKNF